MGRQRGGATGCWERTESQRRHERVQRPGCHAQQQKDHGRTHRPPFFGGNIFLFSQIKKETLFLLKKLDLLKMSVHCLRTRLRSSAHAPAL
jgi:hypothetical protein